MFRVLLITAQNTNGSKTHDQYQVPAAGIVHNIASNFQMLDTSNAGSQRLHSSTEFFDMFVADIFLVLNEDVVLQHHRILAPAGMIEGAALSFSAANPAAIL